MIKYSLQKAEVTPCGDVVLWIIQDGWTARERVVIVRTDQDRCYFYDFNTGGTISSELWAAARGFIRKLEWEAKDLAAATKDLK